MKKILIWAIVTIILTLALFGAFTAGAYSVLIGAKIGQYDNIVTIEWQGHVFEAEVGGEHDDIYD
jgi:hypothetical protein